MRLTLTYSLGRAAILTITQIQRTTNFNSSLSVSSVRFFTCFSRHLTTSRDFYLFLSITNTACGNCDISKAYKKSVSAISLYKYYSWVLCKCFASALRYLRVFLLLSVFFSSGICAINISNLTGRIVLSYMVPAMISVVTC